RRRAPQPGGRAHQLVPARPERLRQRKLPGGAGSHARRQRLASLRVAGVRQEARVKRRHTQVGLALAGALVAGEADARQVGLHSPTGRRIYEPTERFDEVIEHKRRVVVSEVAVGAGPEGNLAMLLGVLNVPVRRLDLFAGVGIEANPAALCTGSARYTFNFD